MMRRIISNLIGHPLKNTKVLFCEICLQGKLGTQLSMSKVDFEFPIFLQRIQRDIYGSIHPASRPFKYFMVLEDASYKWSHVCLLSTHNVTFARLFV